MKKIKSVANDYSSLLLEKMKGLQIEMILCKICGNKRCPHATDEALECTSSNDAGQVGNSYTAEPPYQSEDVLNMVQDKWASLPRELLIRAIRRSIPAVAHASIKNEMYKENYDELDNILSHVYNIEHPAAPKGEE